jgi:hypothetical protein
MRYFAIFSDSGERINTFVADNMPLSVTDIMSQYPQAIEITEDDQKKYMNGYIRGVNGRPIEKENTLTLSEIKTEKINYITTLSKIKLMETDHDIIEYFELHNLTDSEYASLKTKRQMIRDYRDKTIQNIITSNDIETIKNLTFTL